MMVGYTWISPLVGGMEDERDDELLEKKKHTPDLDLVIHSLKYEESLYT